jgi:hypothetical protein
MSSGYILLWIAPEHTNEIKSISRSTCFEMITHAIWSRNCPARDIPRGSATSDKFLQWNCSQRRNNLAVNAEVCPNDTLKCIEPMLR